MKTKSRRPRWRERERVTKQQWQQANKQENDEDKKRARACNISLWFLSMAHRFYADAVDDVDAFLILYVLSTKPHHTYGIH